MAFFAKFRRKLRTKNFEAYFHRKLRTLGKCLNVKKLRTAEPQLLFIGSYKKIKSVADVRVQGWHHKQGGLQCPYQAGSTGSLITRTVSNRILRTGEQYNNIENR